MKVSLIYNYAQHYRTNIFTLLDKEFDVDFYFGDDMGDVKKMDYSLLHNRVIEVKNRKFGRIEWQSGVLAAALKQYDVYIMLGGPMSLSTWITALIARIRGKKVYFWTHGWYGKESFIQRVLKEAFYYLANGLLLYGNYAKKLMIDRGFDEKKLTVIHNSLLYDSQVIIRDSLKETPVFKVHFNNQFPTVVFVGRLTLIKKLDQLLIAQDICKDEGYQFNVVFIGDGCVRTKLERLADKLGLAKNVWFYGSTYNEEELSLLLYNADLCVAPGNIGLTAMHALVYGCPCLSHNNFAYQMPEFEAIQEGVTGSFFEYNNIKDLADCIKSWLSVQAKDRDSVRNACFKEIDENWNPHIQINIIKNVISC